MRRKPWLTDAEEDDEEGADLCSYIKLFRFTSCDTEQPKLRPRDRCDSLTVLPELGVAASCEGSKEGMSRVLESHVKATSNLLSRLTM